MGGFRNLRSIRSKDANRLIGCPARHANASTNRHPLCTASMNSSVVGTLLFAFWKKIDPVSVSIQ